MTPSGPTTVQAEKAKDRVARRKTRVHPLMHQPGADIRAPGVINPAGLAKSRPCALWRATPLVFEGEEKDRITGGPPRPNQTGGRHGVGFLTIE